MPQTDAFSELWDLIRGVIALRATTFQTLQNQPHSLLAALSIAFIAGVAQSLSQIVVLFINQVRPLRFVLSLLISAVLFVVGFGFWALSTWISINTVFTSYLPLSAVIRTIGFSYAPLMLGVFVVMPYFGSAIFILLSIWTLLAVVVGIDAISTLALWEAFGSVALGWIGIQLIQKTVGQPIASLGQWITNWVAGEDLIRNRNRLAEELYVGLRAQITQSDPLSQMPPTHPANVPFDPRK
ncbi:hypothetical protein [Synechococcus sp. PCC 7335]|uniref:hypothetical protein n=1 Tax=Synechococcus sp. (strain ATCC 29403 / PCC 7335) TaxID=91464 RepID=UPI0002D5EAAD|nr:hypothetical protein [Synechococcus sp. PCC 7335]